MSRSVSLLEATLTKRPVTGTTWEDFLASFGSPRVRAVRIRTNGLIEWHAPGASRTSDPKGTMQLTLHTKMHLEEKPGEEPTFTIYENGRKDGRILVVLPPDLAELKDGVMEDREAGFREFLALVKTMRNWYKQAGGTLHVTEAVMRGWNRPAASGPVTTHEWPRSLVEKLLPVPVGSPQQQPPQPRAVTPPHAPPPQLPRSGSANPWDGGAQQAPACTALALTTATADANPWGTPTPPEQSSALVVAGATPANPFADSPPNPFGDDSRADSRNPWG
jgi:hypothetical protein